MPILNFTLDLNAPLEKVWTFHDTVETLFKLTPPDKHASLDGTPEPMRAGVIYKIRVRQFGLIPIRMDSEIFLYEPPHRFADRQLRGPFKSWTHEHSFTALDANRTRLTDHVEYELPLGPLGWLADDLFIRRDIIKMFAYRHNITRDSLSGAL